MKSFVVLFYLLVISLTYGDEVLDPEPFPDYYAMLNVSHSAGMREIKRSFRKLAMEFHPDKNKTEGAQVLFQELSEAYSVLGDVEKKAEYDELFQLFYHLDEDIHTNEVREEQSDLKEDFAPLFKTEDSSESPGEEKEEPQDEEDSEEADVKEEMESEGTAPPQNKTSSSSDLDDETLYKVLKFLADNDYVITKRTRKVPRSAPNPEQFSHQSEHSRNKRATDNEYTTYTDYTNTDRTSGSGEKTGSGGRTGFKSTGHEHHGHTWTGAHQHKPRYENLNARYSSQFQGSEQVYCRSTTRWEGTVKITSRTCF